MNWHCGNCGKKYTTYQLIDLKKIKMVETDDDKNPSHGYTSVCNCGYIFHKDKWNLIDFCTINDELLKVSTVFLELDHFGFLYETMIFPQGDIICEYQMRYKTKNEAINGHYKILNKLREGEFKIVSSVFELKI